MINDIDALDIRLLVLDIDGTIAGQSNDVREPVKQAIRSAQAKGVQVAIATGRMYCSALRFYHEVGSTLPLLAYQGAWIQDPATQQIYQHLPVSRTTAEALWIILRVTHCDRFSRFTSISMTSCMFGKSRQKPKFMLNERIFSRCLWVTCEKLYTLNRQRF